MSLIMVSSNASALDNPVLNFTDIINGPSTGLNDGNGSGAIVTIWGQNLGLEQGASKVMFKDSAGSIKEVSHVYYWKAADGKKPSGPADLYTSHNMIEIAVSIPESVVGAGEIYVQLNDEPIPFEQNLKEFANEISGPAKSNSLPFTVRDGAIYHVKKMGSNTEGDGSFCKPWSTISQLSYGAAKKIAPGDLIYVHDGVNEIDGDNGRNKTTGLYLSGHKGTAESQTAFVAYPNARVLAQGVNIGIGFYKNSGVVISKYVVKAGNHLMPSNNNILPKSTAAIGIQTSQFGRIVANEVTQTDGMCVSGMQGAISGNAKSFDAVSNLKVLGNYIHDWGCDQSSHFGHVTYLSNRSAGKWPVEAWQYGWNHLLNNKSKFGLHSYDETYSGQCGDVLGTIVINSNVVNGQKGPGISLGAKNSKGICWNVEVEIYSNILINTGLGPADENGVSSSAIRIVDKGLDSKISIFNNTVYNWASPELAGRKTAIEVSGYQDNVEIDLHNNIFYTDEDFRFEFNDAQFKDNLNGRNNIWYSSVGNPVLAIAPVWDLQPIIFDPQLIYSNGSLSFGAETSAESAGIPLGIRQDILGNRPAYIPTVGAIEFVKKQ